MKEHNFASYLSEGPLSKFKRNEFIAKMQLFDPILENVDVVTTSRWTNSVTTPSIERQIAISFITETQALLLKVHLGKKLSINQSLELSYQKYKNQLDSTYHNILNKEKGLILGWAAISWKDYLNLTSEARDKIAFLKLIDECIRRTPNKVTLFFIKDKNNTLLSFVGLIDDIPQVDLPKKYKINPLLLSDSKAALFSYFRNSAHMEIIYGLILNFLFYNPKKYFLFPSRGNIARNLLEKLGSRLVLLSKESSNIGDYCYYSSKVFKFLSNPLCFNLLLEHNELYLKILNSHENYININDNN